ncbi:hypothetical protein V5T82_09660 [Magnetovibrio sp. PR-2]|uniref:hypothetical protein n=1 Tax=Magnetovibrio sp. PR-2 TaxID=3120356 RepID=UPI002FCE1113
MLIISLPFTQVFQAHLHVYDHQHGFDGYEAHQVISHSDLEQATPPHHQETPTIENAQKFFAKLLKFQPLILAVLFVGLLFLLILPSKTRPIRPGSDLIWSRQFVLPPPARAPPLS